MSSKWQETCFSRVSNFVTDRKISLGNVWLIVSTQNYWKECVDEIPLDASFSLLCWWLNMGIWDRVSCMSMLCFSKAQLSLCSLCLPVHKTSPVHLETQRKGPTSLHMKSAALGFCTCGLSDLEYICVSQSHLEQWDLTFRKQWFVESLFLVLFKSYTVQEPFTSAYWRLKECALKPSLDRIPRPGSQQGREITTGSMPTFCPAFYHFCVAGF